MKSKILSLATLAERGACKTSLEKFKAIFGEHAEISVERVSEQDVIEAKFDYDWAADEFFGGPYRTEFYNEYRRRQRRLRDEHGLWWTDVPYHTRVKLMATTWAEFYVNCDEIRPVEKDMQENFEDDEDGPTSPESQVRETSNGN